MTKNSLLPLLDYERWANHEVLTALAAVENPPARAVALMGHLLAAQHVWLARMKQCPAPSVWPDTPVAEMANQVDANTDALLAFLNALPTEPAEIVVGYQNTQGQLFSSRIADIFMHLSHHSAYHRGQIVQLLRPLLPAVPQTDYIFYLRR